MTFYNLSCILPISIRTISAYNLEDKYAYSLKIILTSIEVNIVYF